MGHENLQEEMKTLEAVKPVSCSKIVRNEWLWRKMIKLA
jgi:hypothetical protein